VLSFNGAKYDINLMKQYLHKSLNGLELSRMRRHLGNFPGRPRVCSVLALRAADRGSRTHPAQQRPPRGVRQGASGAGPPPAPSDGSVASDPLEVVQRPVAIMAGTYGRMGGPDSAENSDPGWPCDSDRPGWLGSGRLTRDGLADSGGIAPTRIGLCAKADSDKAALSGLG